MRLDFDNLNPANLSQLFLVLHEVRLKMPDVLVLVLLLGKKEPDLVFRYHLCKDETKYEQGDELANADKDQGVLGVAQKH